MVRRIASQVHKQASRLMAVDVITEPPVWYQAVLDHPPIPLPPRKAPARSKLDLPSPPKNERSLATSRTLRSWEPKQMPIVYLEDRVRRQFFRDHPFEAFRPRSLVEKGQVEGTPSVAAEAWTRLSQRTRNPSSEDAVQFVVNLHEHHKLPLSTAYAAAVAQFRALRSEHHLALSFAVQEAERYGHAYSMTTAERTFVKNEKALQTWDDARGLDEAARAQKRWKVIVDKDVGEWSRGESYVRMWKEGVRPMAAPSLTEPIEFYLSADDAVSAQDSAVEEDHSNS